MTKNFIQRLHCRRHGIRRGGLVGDHSIRCRQIERAALGFHGFQGLRAGGKGPSAAHQQIFQRPVDKEHNAVGVERPEVCRVFDHAAAAGDDLPVLPGKAGGLRGLQLPEACLPLSGKDVRDAPAIGLDDLLVQIHEPLAQPFRQSAAQGRFAR